MKRGAGVVKRGAGVVKRGEEGLVLPQKFLRIEIE